MDVTDLIHVDVEQDMESVSDVLDILEGGNEEVSRRMATFGERWISSSVLLVTVALATYVVVDTSSLEKGSLSVFKSWLQRITPSRLAALMSSRLIRPLHVLVQSISMLVYEDRPWSSLQVLPTSRQESHAGQGV